ncbi:Uncharacterised protein [Candidatus Tiddalikarchaeum anstoanum]|nr:Uncharacterised protein [Candidatus Tiddalikarchaeum anstoanum]
MNNKLDVLDLEDVVIKSDCRLNFMSLPAMIQAEKNMYNSTNYFIFHKVEELLYFSSAGMLALPNYIKYREDEGRNEASLNNIMESLGVSGCRFETRLDDDKFRNVLVFEFDNYSPQNCESGKKVVKLNRNQFNSNFNEVEPVSLVIVNTYYATLDFSYFRNRKSCKAHHTKTEEDEPSSL